MSLQIAQQLGSNEIRSLLGGIYDWLSADVVADQGDIVYAPATVWHQVRFAGVEKATRLAVVGYAFSHVFPAEGGADSSLPTAIVPPKR